MEIYEEKHKDGVVKVSNVATPPTPTERAEKLHAKVRAAYMKKLLPGLEKKQPLIAVYEDIKTPSFHIPYFAHIVCHTDIVGETGMRTVL